MLDMKSITINTGNTEWGSMLFYDIDNYKYTMYVHQHSITSKTLYIELDIKYKSSMRMRTLLISKNGINIVPKKHLLVAREILKLYEDMIIIPAHLSGGKYKIHYYNDILNPKSLS